MNFNKMFKLIVASTALIFTTIGFSHSASMPCGTAKLIVPWGAGGGTDVIFRQMVDKINKNGRKTKDENSEIVLSGGDRTGIFPTGDIINGNIVLGINF